MMNLYLAEMSAFFPNKKIMLIWDQAGWHKSRFLTLFRRRRDLFTDLSLAFFDTTQDFANFSKE
jgi:hypothetical protein